VVRHCHAESLVASFRREALSSDHRLQSGHERFQLVQDTLSPDSALVGSATADEKDISKHLT